VHDSAKGKQSKIVTQEEFLARLNRVDYKKVQDGIGQVDH